MIFSVVALPLTYLPILLDRERPRVHGLRTEREARECARLLYFGVILAISVAAIPLMLLTNGGQG